jgi:formylglycine-generating enzyme required for sulfatase activity
MKFIFAFIKTTIVVVGVMFLTAFTINATDNLGNFSDSALGVMVAGVLGTPERCSQDMVFVDSADGGFCIDQYEVSAGEKCLYSNPASQFETRSNINEPRCIPVSQKDAIPWRFISQTQAVEACIKAGKRLPTNEEWYLASVGTPDNANQNTRNGCNISRNWDTSEPGYTGSGETCVSYYGAHDMVGNVWEWVSDTVKNGQYDGLTLPDSGYVHGVDEAGVAVMTDPKTPDANYNNDRFWSEKFQVTGIFRGGFWDTGSDAGLYSVYAQQPPSFVGIGVGFRCVK